MTSTGFFLPRRKPRRDKLVAIPIGLMLLTFSVKFTIMLPVEGF